MVSTDATPSPVPTSTMAVARATRRSLRWPRWTGRPAAARSARGSARSRCPPRHPRPSRPTPRRHRPAAGALSVAHRRSCARAPAAPHRRPWRLLGRSFSRPRPRTVLCSRDATRPSRCRCGDGVHFGKRLRSRIAQLHPSLDHARRTNPSFVWSRQASRSVGSASAICGLNRNALA